LCCVLFLMNFCLYWAESMPRCSRAGRLSRSRHRDVLQETHMRHAGAGPGDRLLGNGTKRPPATSDLRKLGHKEAGLLLMQGLTSTQGCEGSLDRWRRIDALRKMSTLALAQGVDLEPGHYVCAQRQARAPRILCFMLRLFPSPVLTPVLCAQRPGACPVFSVHVFPVSSPVGNFCACRCVRGVSCGENYFLYGSGTDASRILRIPGPGVDASPGAERIQHCGGTCTCRCP
jgi:hypothetical protein